MAKFLVVNDPHVSDKSPIGRTETYADDIFAKLEECWDIARRTKCDFIVMTGDIFHRFRGPIIAYATTIRLLALFKEAPCPVYALAGNHDVTMAGVDSVWSMPFGVLARADSFTWLSEATVVLGQPTGQVMLVPRNWEPSIDRLAHSFKLKKSEVELKEHYPGCRYTVMVAHASIEAPGGTRIFPYHDADKLPTEAVDVLLAGHLHEDLGIHKLKSGCWFANIGSLARVSRTKHDLARTPEVLVVTLDGGEIEFERHPLTSTRPAEDVFFEKDVVTEREVGDFAAALATALDLEETPLDELIAEHTKGQPDAVVDRLRKYLMEVDES